MDGVDRDDDVDIPTFLEHDVDRYQHDLVTQVQMVHERLYHNMCLYVAVDVYTMA